MSKAELLPVFGGVGNREVLGLVSSKEQAAKLIKKLTHVPQGFDLAVWRRTPFMRELLEAPDGYVFSVSYKFGPVLT